MVEKPSRTKRPPRSASSAATSCRRQIFAELDRQERGAGNEIQLTDSMARLIGRVPFHAVQTTCARYDCGDKVGFLQANIAVGLRRPISRRR